MPVPETWLIRFNDFSEPNKTLAKMTCIVKANGRVVFGDESLPPWLCGTEFSEIITTNNPLSRNRFPVDCFPESVRDVRLRWIWGAAITCSSFASAMVLRLRILICCIMAGA